MVRAGLLCVALVLATGCSPACKNSECPADQVCTSGGCASALSATYKVTLHVTLTDTELDGTDWDSASPFASASPPDPGATLNSLEGNSLARFSSSSDTYSVSTVRDGVRFDSPDGGYDGGLMVLDVYDQDGAPGEGDSVCEAVVGPDAVSVLHAGSWDGGAQGGCRSLSLDFEAH